MQCKTEGERELQSTMASATGTGRRREEAGAGSEARKACAGFLFWRLCRL